MGWSFTIGRIAGTSIKVHGTFVLLLLFAGFSAWSAGGVAVAVESVAVLLGLFACVLLHEFGHIGAARYYGVKTPDILLLPIGGLARLERMPEEPKQEAVIALAGPAVTAALAGIAYVLLRLTGQSPDAGMPTGHLGTSPLMQLYNVNIALLLFNLVPAFPMDGGRVLRALLASRLGLARATKIAATIGQGLAVLFGLYAVANGRVMWALVALFIYFAASGEAASVRERKVLQGVTAGTYMVRDFRTLPAHGTLQQAIDLLVSTEQREIPVVDFGGRVAGLLTRDTLLRGLQGGNTSAEVATAMHTAVPRIGTEVPIDAAMAAMRGAGLRAVPVLDADDRLVGLLTLDNLMDVLLLSGGEPVRRG